MRKTLLALLLALAAWTGIFALCLLFGGGGLTLYFEIPPEAEGVRFETEPAGIVALADTSYSADGAELLLHLRAESRGVTQGILRWDGVGEESFYAPEIRMTLRALPFGILSDSLTGNFTGWGYLAVCLSLFLLTAALILFLASQRERRHAFYSYRATGELGLALFLLLAGFFRADTVLPFLRGENAGTVWALLIGAIVSAQTFMRWTAVALGAFSLLLAVSNLVLVRHEGARPANMLGIAVGLVIVGGAAFGIWMSRSMLTFPLRNVLLNTYAGVFVYLECLLAATVVHAVRAGRHEPDYDKDYILVLGCRIRPDGTLYPLIRGRVDRAVAFWRAQLAATGKRAILVPSGGRGGDEPMSEGEAMARYMLEQGIPADAVLPECESATTRENLLFSRRLTGEGSRVAFATSSYHVYRGGILAADLGWTIDGMGSRTRWYFWPNAFLREFIGLLTSTRLQQVTALALIVILSVGLTLLVM